MVFMKVIWCLIVLISCRRVIWEVGYEFDVCGLVVFVLVV